MAEAKGGKTAEPAQQRDAQEVADEVRRTSSDARFSTYREAKRDELGEVDEKLPPGRIVVQERGEASEGGGKPFDADR
jgi:hypothetical protein